MLLGSREAVAEAFVHTSVVSRLDSKSGSNVAESWVSPRGEAEASDSHLFGLSETCTSAEANGSWEPGASLSHFSKMSSRIMSRLLRRVKIMV